VSEIRAEEDIKTMEAQKTIPIAFSRLGPEIRAAPFAMTARRLFGLDVGDWAIVLVGVTLVILMLALV
jgi:hypothetical protein